MPDAPTTLSIAEVTALLARHFGAPVTGLQPLSGGNIAQVYRFTAGQREYVVRFAEAAFVAFEQEAFITNHFASPAVPIPRIAAIGEVDGLSYAIAEAVPGVHLDSLPPAEAEAMVPQVLDVLDAIHAADTRSTTGWGWIGRDGNGRSASWRQHIALVVDPDYDHPYYGTWASMFATTALTPSEVEPVARALETLLPACPEDRTLLHGDYGFTNVLVHEGRITAVLDWANALYGDSLYDLAWLDFWPGGVPYAEIGLKRAAARGDDLTGFSERIACYQSYIALDAMRFFAKRDDAGGLEFVRSRVRDLRLAHSPRP